MAKSATSGSKRISFLSRLSLAPLLIWSIILVLTPNALMILYSLWQSEDGVLKQVISIDNYVEALTNPVTISVLTRTLLVALGASVRGPPTLKAPTSGGATCYRATLD